MNDNLNNFLIILEKLLDNSKPLWGKMTPQHMVEHLILTLQTSDGKIKVECVTPTEKLPASKRFLLSSRPLPKLFINPVIGPDLLPLKFSNLDVAKKMLKQELEDYYKFFKENPDAKTTHVTFGDLDKDEWGRAAFHPCLIHFA
jgi:oxepin-CoA hydrolase/3-oxo-5,6-dehydrosuberyl-CoA semialdehyde dehydrogenase